MVEVSDFQKWMNVEGELTRLREELEESKERETIRVETYIKSCEEWQTAIDAAEARVRELEEDKARLDWLDSMEETNVYDSEGFICCMWRHGYEHFDCENIRAAIDAAKEE